jgi:general secretion pathway protein G
MPCPVLVGGLKAYNVAMGRYPSTEEGLTVLYQPPEDVETLAKWQAGGGPFIEGRSALIDPWGRELIYVCPGEHNPSTYDLSSSGLDGRAGTDDDLTNW